MKPKHLFYLVALGATAAAALHAIRGDKAVAALLAAVALAAVANAQHPSANRATTRDEMKRFFGIR